jgi:hypothetical protein
MQAARGRIRSKNRSGSWRKAVKEATAIASHDAHSPEPAVRKSGIPEAVEMPAPVRTTGQRASRIILAAS